MKIRCPKTLSKVARRKFKEFVSLLSERRTLTTADSTLLEIAAEQYARWRQFVDDINVRGAYVENITLDKNREPITRIVPNPSVRLAEQINANLQRMLKELGITPASREQVKPAAPAHTDLPKTTEEKLALLERNS